MTLFRFLGFKIFILILSFNFFSGCSQHRNIKSDQPFDQTVYIVHFENGKKYFRQKAYEKAISSYTKAAAMHSEAKLFTNRGAAFYAVGQYDMAIEDFSRALDINPLDAKALNNRGAAYYQKGEYRKAVADYNRSIKIEPDYQTAHANLNLAWGKDGRHSKKDNSDSYPVKIYPEKKNHSRQVSPAEISPARRTSQQRFEYIVKSEQPSNNKKNQPDRSVSIGDAELNDPSGRAFYSIHIASYQTMRHAEEAMNEFKRDTDQDVFVKPVDIPGKGRWYRVFMGKYKNRSQAFSQGKKLKASGIIKYFSVHAS